MEMKQSDYVPTPFGALRRVLTSRSSVFWLAQPPVGAAAPTPAAVGIETRTPGALPALNKARKE